MYVRIVDIRYQGTRVGAYTELDSTGGRYVCTYVRKVLEKTDERIGGQQNGKKRVTSDYYQVNSEISPWKLGTNGL